jgi:ABC-type multidrug transport system fused ATPase/permease subunit
MSSSSSSSDGESVELQDWAGQKRKIRDVEAGLEDGEEDASGGKHHRDGLVVGGDEENGLGVVSKYAKVNQPCPFSVHPPKSRYNLEWRNINYKVVIPMPPSNFFVKLLLKLPIPNTIANYFKTKKEVPILNNVSGRVAAGQLIAIMGPTGSGKTTLLNVLARRIKLNVTGDILINGEAVQGRRLKRRMAYVLQDDIFFPNLTVRDTISYTAYLKLPKSLSWKEKRERVEEIITEMGIQRCSNTIVGGGWVVRHTPLLLFLLLLLLRPA